MNVSNGFYILLFRPKGWDESNTIIPFYELSKRYQHYAYATYHTACSS